MTALASQPSSAARTKAVRHGIRTALLLLAATATLCAQTPEVTTDHFTYLPGEDIVATFRNGPANPKDWIGVYPDGVEPGSTPSTIWRYIDNTQTGAKGFTEGSVSFPGGLNLAGDWVVYFLLNDGYTKLASTKLRVVDPSGSFVRLDKSVYAPNEAISVAFTNGPANAKDWIGLYPVGQVPGPIPSLKWNYVDGTQTGSAGKSEGVITFPDGLPTNGQYVAYLLLNDGYDVLASESFAVATPPAGGPRLLSIRPAANATNVVPTIEFLAAITNGTTQVATNSIALSIDNAVVPATVTVGGGLVSIGYTNTVLLTSGSTHTYKLVFADTGTPSTRTTNEASFAILPYTDLQLPAPVYFENFDSTEEGKLPAGWSSVTYSVVNDENADLQDLNSKSYADWLVVSRDRFTQPFLSYDTHDSTSDYERVLTPNPANVVNGRVTPDMISGRFAFADSGYRSGGNQYLVLYTPDFDLSGKTNIYLSFHSIWEQNQDSIAAVEYSIDQGASWLPIVYMLDGPDVVKDEAGNVDAIATFTTDQSDVARYTDPVTGEDKGGTYGAFIGAAIAADLAPFISARVDDNPVESKRVEYFPLPKAGNQAKVRFRFAHAGTDSWYFGIDDFGLYAISASTGGDVRLQATRAGNNLVISWPADATGYILESSSALPSSTWTPVQGAAGNSATVPMSGTAQFYRLRK